MLSFVDFLASSEELDEAQQPAKKKSGDPLGLQKAAKKVQSKLNGDSMKKAQNKLTSNPIKKTLNKMSVSDKSVANKVAKHATNTLSDVRKKFMSALANPLHALSKSIESKPKSTPAQKKPQKTKSAIKPLPGGPQRFVHT